MTTQMKHKTDKEILADKPLYAPQPGEILKFRSSQKSFLKPLPETLVASNQSIVYYRWRDAVKNIELSLN